MFYKACEKSRVSLTCQMDPNKLPKSLLAMASLAIATRCQEVIDFLASLVMHDFESDSDSDSDTSDEDEEDDDDEDDDDEEEDDEDEEDDEEQDN